MSIRVYCDYILEKLGPNQPDEDESIYKCVYGDIFLKTGDNVKKIRLEEFRALHQKYSFQLVKRKIQCLQCLDLVMPLYTKDWTYCKCRKTGMKDRSMVTGADENIRRFEEHVLVTKPFPPFG